MTTGLTQSPHSEYFFNFGDKAGEAHFVLWHHMRHHTYDLLLSQQGQTIPPLDLKGKVDADWLHRHGVRHGTLRRIAGTVTGNSTIGFKTVHWDSRSEVNDWLRNHAVDHQRLDAFFGLP